MEEMRQRIVRNNRSQEIQDIIQVGDSSHLLWLLLTEQAMCDIAKDRANKLQPASRM